jgi:hypothetical protein
MDIDARPEGWLRAEAGTAAAVPATGLAAMADLTHGTEKGPALSSHRVEQIGQCWKSVGSVPTRRKNQVLLNVVVSYQPLPVDTGGGHVVLPQSRLGRGRAGRAVMAGAALGLARGGCCPARDRRRLGTR